MKSGETPKLPAAESVENQLKPRRQSVNRRSFLKNTAVAGVGVVGAGMLTTPDGFAEENHRHLTRGDAALLRFGNS
jgi:hypothetical protein